ncbi:MAG: hypothetical protein HC927_00915 [Deltaproteobacteria bacterium]|nr:hypothetical protein [Deltaproteobacteria bacterium]
MAEHAGWDAAAVLAVATDLGYDDDDAAAVAQETIPERLRVIVETSSRLGVAPDVVFDWATTTPTMTQTAAIKAATRAKYGEDRWPAVGKPLRDVIRERQRDALVDAAIAITPSLRTANDVFEHLLIDVEMGHCMMTSRIKQAIASVQIFIHRVLLHLEVEEVSFDPEAIERWDWMKNYRVWEANRKVFLYPENWIEPELRRDKTPEFEELEATLMQGVLDQYRVEKALGIYLEKLARVANLEMVSTYQDPTSKELWLLARTHARPHEWFMRRRLGSREWTAWEVVPHEIDSDAVVLLVNKGRVHLFWANEHDAVQSDDEHVPVYFTIGHLEKSPEGWGKATMSDPSPTMLLPPHEQYRLNFLILDRNIYLYVFWHNPQIHAGKIGAATAFYFDPVARRVRRTAMFGQAYTQTIDTTIGEGEQEKVVATRFLKSNGFIPLPAHHAFEGQRNLRVSAVEIDAGSAQSPGSARFVQGWVTRRLFDNASQGRSPAFVHQADMLIHADLRNTFLPALYDDRRRKYVLQPTIDASMQEPNPSNIALLHPSDYATCPSTSVSLPEPDQTRPGVRRIQDNVQTRRPWDSRIPGRSAALVSLEGSDSPDASAFGTPLLLSQSKDIMQGGLALVEDEGDYPEQAWEFAFVLQMEAMYHPFALYMQEMLASGGWLGLYAPPSDTPLFRQLGSYDPFDEEMGISTSLVPGELPIEEFDFDFGGPYSTYNWELFYHVPMLIAGKLATEQKWDEAQRWYHLMFNPIDLVAGEEGPSRFWRIKPFFEQAGTLAKDQLEAMLGIGVSGEEKKAAVKAFATQVAIWEDNPFDPHAVARVRPGVYQRALLREYFDNLIAWADNLFRRDTIESITEATVLYIVVAQILGRRPQEVPGPDQEPKSFAQLQTQELDAFGNAMVQLESWIHLPAQAVEKQGCGEGAPRRSWVSVPVVSHFWYFCYPPNPELLKYWDIVEDRLFKIRHCQNIDGVERSLPLFEPPIDPGLLVQAAAAGVDIQSVLAELDSGLPPYRFRSVHARAMAFTNTLKSLGGALLSALEKQDAEELSRIRSAHELEMLARVRDVRVQQRDEAAAAITAIERGIEGAKARERHYMLLLIEGLSAEEDRAFELNKKARNSRHSQQALLGLAGIFGAFPQIKVGLPPSIEFGGQHLATIMNAGAAVAGMVASEYEYHAAKANTVAGYKRRTQDWEFQYIQATHDVGRMDKDLIAAKIRLEIAERELANHDLQTEHARSVDEYMRTKFTNRELYDWMIGQLSTLYFQTYQLAFDLAKRAERAYRHELAIDAEEPPIIKFGYWDSLRKGLLAGDKLGHDLERLDLAYMDRDVREFELRKSISLAELNPDELRALRETGECTFTLPEALYDLDHPGHYLRRIRAVRLTIPAVVGPFTTLGARLQLESHVTRIDPSVDPEYDEHENDARFRHGTGAGQAIATSTAMSDGGLFNLDFRDERYLPFEYAGAVSTWKLVLPEKVRQFDYRTIEDVIIHIDYTARDGGASLRSEAEEALEARLNAMLGGSELPLALAVHEAFPNEWEQFFAVESGNHVLTLPITADHFPYFARRTGFDVIQVDLVMLLDSSLAEETVTSIAAELDLQEGSENFVQSPDTAYMSASFDAPPAAQAETWTLTIADSVIPALLQDGDDALDPTKLVGMVMIVRYMLATA